MSPQLCYFAPFAKPRRALLEKLRTCAVFWETLFLGAPWPTQLLQAHVVFIPKPGDGPKTTRDLCAFTVLSALYSFFLFCMSIKEANKVARLLVPRVDFWWKAWG